MVKSILVFMCVLFVSGGVHAQETKTVVVDEEASAKIDSQDTQEQKSSTEMARVCIRLHCYNSVVARTSMDLMRGLQGYTYLGDHDGMFFVFPQMNLHGFWMRGMVIPIDIIWLDSEMRIVHIEHSVQPCLKDVGCRVYKPKQPAKYVLEVGDGQAMKRRMMFGDKLQVNWEVDVPSEITDTP